MTPQYSPDKRSQFTQIHRPSGSFAQIHTPTATTTTTTQLELEESAVRSFVQIYSAKVTAVERFPPADTVCSWLLTVVFSSCLFDIMNDSCWNRAFLRTRCNERQAPARRPLRDFVHPVCLFIFAIDINLFHRESSRLARGFVQCYYCVSSSHQSLQYHSDGLTVVLNKLVIVESMQNSKYTSCQTNETLLQLKLAKRMLA